MPKIPTAPSPPSSGGSAPPPSSGSSGGSGGSGGGGYSGGGGSGGGGGGGGGYDPYAYAKRQERKADNEAYRKYMDQAATMQKQIDALRVALGKKGFIKALRKQLRNVGLQTRQVDRQLMVGYRDRFQALAKTAEDNEKAAAGQSGLNQMNKSRERVGALAEAAAQGAGESDTLRAQEMSLRNWQANQGEINRSFFDTRSSVQSSLTDLNVDTRTARMNNRIEGNADREQLWTEYYDQRSETLTALGNALGQQAEYYGLANEARSGRGARGKQKAASRRSGKAFRGASLEAGKAWKSPGVPKKLRKWDGRDLEQERLNNAKFASAPGQLTEAARPEGATLRSWT